MRTRSLEVRPRLAALQRHLGGVKRRVLFVLVAFGLGSSLTWYYRKTVITWLLLPAQGQLSATGRPVFTSPTEMFSLTVHLAIVGGCVVAAPVLVFHVFRFLRPLLSKKQRRSVAIFLPAVFVCFLGGAAFAYFVILPTSLRFLLGFGTDAADPMIRITEYMDIAQAMLFWLGIVFELPLAMFLVVKLRLVSYQRIKGFRRYVPLAAFILSAVITPTVDLINSTLVAVPIIVLYETGIILAWMARPRQKKLRHV